MGFGLCAQDHGSTSPGNLRFCLFALQDKICTNSQEKVIQHFLRDLPAPAGRMQVLGCSAVPCAPASPQGGHTIAPHHPIPKTEPWCSPSTHHPSHGRATHHAPGIPLEGKRGGKAHLQIKRGEKNKKFKNQEQRQAPVHGQIKTIVQEEPNPQHLTIHTRLETLL